MIRRTIALVALPAALAGAAPAWATFPGDNGRLVVQRPAGEQMDLFTIRAGGKPKQLLGGRAFDDKAEWSPDGRRIAFARSGKDPIPEEIWTANAQGGDLRRLTNWGKISAAPTWTAEGRIVYFTTKDYPPPGSPEEPCDIRLHSRGDGDDMARGLGASHGTKSYPTGSTTGASSRSGRAPMSSAPRLGATRRPASTPAARWAASGCPT